MQQSMDNAPQPSARNLPFPSGQDRGYPILLTQKTSTLLSEALHMLQRIKDVKERKWVEAFIHRLGNLAADLEESNSREIPKEESILQLPDAKNPTIPSSPTSPAANKLNKAQAKYQVTSAQLNDVLPINEGHMNRQVVTKPSLLSTKADDDLILQLHNQNNRMKHKFTPLDAHVTFHTRPLDSTVTQGVTPPTTPLSSPNGKPKETNQAEEKTRQTLLSKLLNEIDVLKNQGETEKNIRNSFSSHHVADFTNPDFALDQKHSFLDEDDEFEIEEDEGAAAGELEEDEEPLKNTISPSWQQVMEAAKAEESHLVPERQQYESMKEFVPPEPTMSDDMERQLRAGKIVVLSDSLVRTNFQSGDDNDNVKENSGTQSISPSRSPADESGISNKLTQNNSDEDD